VSIPSPHTASCQQPFIRPKPQLLGKGAHQRGTRPEIPRQRRSREASGQTPATGPMLTGALHCMPS
jgi:hypothetical protein